jgi:hypothetical protein
MASLPPLADPDGKRLMVFHLDFNIPNAP